MFACRLTEPRPIVRLRDEMDRLFERFFGDYEPYRAWDPFNLRRYPAANVWQDEDDIFIEAELPGLTTDDIELTVLGNELTIKGERAALRPKEGATLHRRERGAGTFSRVVHLPANVNEGKVEAAFNNGVLSVTLAKARAAKSRRIPVRAKGATT